MWPYFFQMSPETFLPPPLSEFCEKKTSYLFVFFYNIDSKKIIQNKPRHASERFKWPYLFKFSRGRIPPDPPTKTRALRALGLGASRPKGFFPSRNPPLEKNPGYAPESAQVYVRMCEDFFIDVRLTMYVWIESKRVTFLSRACVHVRVCIHVCRYIIGILYRVPKA